MATKKATQQTTEQEAAEARAAEEQKAAKAKAAENAGAGTEVEGAAGGKPEGDDAGSGPATEEKPAAELASVEELAGKFRAPSWQTAALNRFMGWEAGKKVTEKEYQAALARLKNRRIGG